ncbi:hypothetical protein [Methylorubrum thiocyanatum]
MVDDLPPQSVRHVVLEPRLHVGRLVHGIARRPYRISEMPKVPLKGLLGDRRGMLINDDGRKISAVEEHRLISGGMIDTPYQRSFAAANQPYVTLT